MKTRADKMAVNINLNIGVSPDYPIGQNQVLKVWSELVGENCRKDWKEGILGGL